MHRSKRRSKDKRRSSGNDNYYAIVNRDTLLPTLTMAPEVFNNHKFNESTDVWAFAITLIEMYQLGDMPYQFLKSEHFIDFVKNDDGILQDDFGVGG